VTPGGQKLHNVRLKCSFRHFINTVEPLGVHIIV